MSEFVASNGKRIELESGHLEILDTRGHGVHYLLPENTVALREFFLAERDAELGRWRSKEHPDWFAIAEGIGVRVCDEAMGRVYGFGSPANTDRYAYDPGGNIAGYVAREFFAAHPDSKPWHDAKPGEAWVIEAADWGTKACIVDDDYFMWSGEGLPIKSEQITAGRRIWPEGA